MTLCGRYSTTNPFSRAQAREERLGLAVRVARPAWGRPGDPCLSVRVWKRPRSSKRAWRRVGGPGGELGDRKQPDCGAPFLSPQIGGGAPPRFLQLFVSACFVLAT